MVKTCKFCLKKFVSSGKNSWKKQYCNIICQQKFWTLQRNISGSSREEQRKKAKSLRNIHLTAEQLQIVYGTLLGDSSIQERNFGRCRLKMCHGMKQKDYLEFKKEKLKPFVIQTSASMCESNGFAGALPSFHYNSITHQDFANLYGLFYIKSKGKKRKYINMNILNRLEPTAILYWFLDDGCYKYQPKKSTHICFLSTQCFTLQEHKMLKKWFWRKWRIETVISYDKIHKAYILRFKKKALENFNKLFLKPFKHFVPSCLHYKFPKF